MKSNAVFWCILLVSCRSLNAEDALTQLTTAYCAKCHGGDNPKAELSLEGMDAELFSDTNRLEMIIEVLAENQMPPKKSAQPSDALRRAAVDLLKAQLEGGAQPARLKRLTCDEYTNAVNDLFDVRFNLQEILPPDPAGDGFNKWGETQNMSPNQVESYLRAARFIAERLILDERPTQRSWEFDIDNFRGTGRGDFQTETQHVLTTHYPWRSILYFMDTRRPEPEIFRIPEFGRYWIQADAKSQYSDKSETVSLSTGDPRYPTNIEKVARAVLPPDGSTMFWDLTLAADTHISFTYDSAATWNTGNAREQYQGRQVRFTKVRITGPITEDWPTIAEQRIFDGTTYLTLDAENSRKFVEHVVGLLLNRSLPDEDVADLEKLVCERMVESNSTRAAARTLLTALLSSPHFIYKHEPEALDENSLAHRLAYFLWNSVPDSQLRQVARSGELRGSLSAQVERMLEDPRSERFCEDFTRQWLSTDKIDEIGPDDRVHDEKRVTFMRIRELAREPQAFFREVLKNDLSMINFIDSDFAMLNDETSQYYGFGDVKSREFQRVAIPADSERGGLIGQAGLLKLTSGKHQTSPILRGTWIIQSIYGEKLNPPPGLVVEEPDIRGAETVKEVIELHKTSETCNRCHARIDPFGLALEHYDEMGLWRDQYRHVETQAGIKEVKLTTATIDTSAQLPDGRQLDSMTDLKAVLMEDREQIIKGILSKLASYALGREMGIRDEVMIGEIYDRIAEKDYSLRAAIHEIVAHAAFAQR